MRVFGCTAYLHMTKNERQYLDAETHKCSLLGYPCNKNGYQLYNQANQRVAYNMFDETTNGVDKEHHSTTHQEDQQTILDNFNDECISDEAEHPDVRHKRKH